MIPVLAITTAPSRDTAEKLAKTLVENRLAACVNILGDVKSVYWWEDAIQTEVEHVLLIKTLTEKLKSVKVLETNHPYEVPELLVLNISDGLENYLRWIGDVIRK